MLPTPLFGPVPGGMEIMVVLLVAVLLFGANKLPKLARSTGQAMGEFRKGREEIEREIRDSAAGVERDDDAKGTPDSDDTPNSNDTLDPDDTPNSNDTLDPDDTLDRERTA